MGNKQRGSRDQLWPGVLYAAPGSTPAWCFICSSGINSSPVFYMQLRDQLPPGVLYVALGSTPAQCFTCGSGINSSPVFYMQLRDQL